MNERIEYIQQYLNCNGVDAYLVFTGDDHGSEYVVEHYKTRAYLSGFTGSAGTLVILKERAYLWTDGRYFLQAEAQLGGSGITLMKQGERGVPTIAEFLRSANVKKVEFDFKTATVVFVERLKEALPEAEFVDSTEPVDMVWTDRPPITATPVYRLPDDVAGQTALEKLAALRAKIAQNEGTYALVSALDEVAWLLNLRGSDVEYNPVNYAFLLVGEGRCDLYIDGRKLDAEVRDYLRFIGVTVRGYDGIYVDVKGLNGNTVLLDYKTANYALYNAVLDKKDMGNDLVKTPKAIKNPVEIAGEKSAHIMDGVAMVRFMNYVKTNVGKEKMTELSLATKLEQLRRQSGSFLQLSFETICGYREHGAIVHYAASESSDVPVEKDGFLLVDSGAHYLCGTTDVTRTFALGNITKEMKRDYTLVLKSHIALARAVFPEGTTGSALDVLARQPLYRSGLDYRHGTGHGVGHILNVHEGPHTIGKSGEHPLSAGMVTSDEPGLYLSGKYGIRHENLLLCVERGETEYGKFLCFEPLTKVPFDRDGIDVSMLDGDEREWLNTYHKQVYDELSPYLSPKDKRYLKKVTAKL